MSRYPVTPEGLAKLRVEYRRLIEFDRPAVVLAIEEARAHGDISENSEYEDAKHRQGLIEGRIRDVEEKIGSADVIDPRTLKGTKVMFGATVTVQDIDTGDIATYTILGAEEADTRRGRISIESPLGRALLGKVVGDEVTFYAPKGRRTVELTELRFGV